MKNKNDTQKKEGKIYFELKLCFDAIRWILSPYLGDVNRLPSFLLRTSSSIKNIFKKHFLGYPFLFEKSLKIIIVITPPSSLH